MELETKELSRAIFTPAWPTGGARAKLNTILIEAIGDVYRFASPKGVSVLSLKSHSKALRAEIVRALLRIDYVLPHKGSVLDKGHAAWMNVTGIRTMMASHIEWKHTSMEEIEVHLSPVITELLPILRSEFEREDVYNKLRIPGAYAPGLYNFLASREHWPFDVSLDDLRKIWWPEGGRQMPPAYGNTSNFLNIVLNTAMNGVHKYTDLKVQSEKIMGTLGGHHQIVGIRFHLQGIRPPQTRYPSALEEGEEASGDASESSGKPARRKSGARRKALAAK